MTTATQKIPSGYKRTDIGIIPADWDVKRIESLTPQGKKYGIVDGPFGSNLKTEHYRKSGIPIITSGYVTDGHFFADEYLYVDKEKFKQEKRSAVKGGDIVMAKIGARCGASAILPKTHEEGILSGNALKITIDESKFSTFFIWQILWNLYTKGDLEALKTTGAQPALSMANLKKYEIAIPTSKTEQDAIATALLDTDAFIKKIEKLIEKKRNIKQGAMQELFTGKRRLPGFSGEWENKSIEELEKTGDIKLSRGKVISRRDIDNFSGDYYPIYSSSIHNNGEFGRYGLYMFEEELITWSVDGGGNFFYRPKHKFSVTNVCGFMRVNTKRFSYQFLATQLQFLHSKLFFDYTMKAHPSVIRKAYSVDIPNLAEQTAIAKVFFDMDTEIEKLESELMKYKDIKQGMMQTLLTGKIRLLTKLTPLDK